MYIFPIYSLGNNNQSNKNILSQRLVTKWKTKVKHFKWKNHYPQNCLVENPL